APPRDRLVLLQNDFGGTSGRYRPPGRRSRGLQLARGIRGASSGRALPAAFGTINGMKPLLAALLLLCPANSLLAETDAEVNARKNALDVAGALTHEGLKLRDGPWGGTGSNQHHALIALKLCAGDQHSVAVGPPD